MLDLTQSGTLTLGAILCILPSGWLRLFVNLDEILYGEGLSINLRYLQMAPVLYLFEYC